MLKKQTTVIVVQFELVNETILILANLHVHIFYITSDLLVISTFVMSTLYDLCDLSYKLLQEHEVFLYFFVSVFYLLPIFSKRPIQIPVNLQLKYSIDDAKYIYIYIYIYIYWLFIFSSLFTALFIQFCIICKPRFSCSLRLLVILSTLS